MGRSEVSVALPPQAVRRAARAKLAKETLNKTIPALLVSYPRAKGGVDGAELLVEPPVQERRTPDSASSTPSIRIGNVDTITAATSLSLPDGNPVGDLGRVAVLNMASPLRPGGGFLQGATSQEESLCMRTTLYPSLRDDFYRLPEIGAIYTPDVLVFRDAEGKDLAKKDRFFVDVISAGMLRFPELHEGQYANAADRQSVEAKMRAVMRICVMKGAKKVVLGAWGCGAYGNPVEEVARAWRKVLLGGKKHRKEALSETWTGVQEIVFAVTDPGMFEVFRQQFEDVLQSHEAGPPNRAEQIEDGLGADKDESRELKEKIAELEEQLKSVKNSSLRDRIQSVIDSLRARLVQ
jgi:uncharacterized protein (TIGR02452 family)